MSGLTRARVTAPEADTGGWCCDHDLGTTEDTGAGLSACCLASASPGSVSLSLGLGPDQYWAPSVTHTLLAHISDHYNSLLASCHHYFNLIFSISVRLLGSLSEWKRKGLKN